ncbi:hypothetical protein NDU88_003773 [Pleurodeles waltl]|uniref:Uncharacterized protein n=1 Tax=Pleurodeles waltl TaxID=8319 RepID=A0AAV7KVV8_PLEWA|nr:hypothetical protein NDU88_003773 [Pleurodeles waltl]
MHSPAPGAASTSASVFTSLELGRGLTSKMVAPQPQHRKYRRRRRTQSFPFSPRKRRRRPRQGVVRLAAVNDDVRPVPSHRCGVVTASTGGSSSLWFRSLFSDFTSPWLW